MKRFAICILGAFLVAASAAGHGGLQHVMGTVKSISANSITVTTADTQSKDVMVVVLPTTKFQKSGVDATAHDLKIGDRVVIHAKPDGDKLDAVTVAFGKMPSHSDSSADARHGYASLMLWLCDF